MANKRYHIHLICDSSDQVAMLDRLVMFFENKAFLTTDLNQGDQDSANYSRRCIERCDYVFMLVGNTYGQLSKTGVSQLHLSYIYANTKAKPIMILLKLHNDPEQLPRQLADFIRMIEKDNSDSVYYYDDDVKLKEFLMPIYNKFIREYKTGGWVRQAEINQAHSSPNLSSNTVNKTAHNSATFKSAIKNKTISKQPFRSLNKDDSVNRSKLAATSSTSSLKNVPDNVDVAVTINFTTHAYQGGNLTEIDLVASVTWRQILQSINDFSHPISEFIFQRTMNQLVQEQALDLVKERMAGVHAVARTQVSEYNLEQIQAQLIDFSWVRLVPDEKSVSSKLFHNAELLQLTQLGKNMLKS